MNLRKDHFGRVLSSTLIVMVLVRPPLVHLSMCHFMSDLGIDARREVDGISPCERIAPCSLCLEFCPCDSGILAVLVHVCYLLGFLHLQPTSPWEMIEEDFCQD